MKNVSKPVDITFVLGIRPDVIRASLILDLLYKHPQINMRFVWSGQHYSENLKDVFFQELNIPDPDITFEASGENDIEVASKIMNQLFSDLRNFPPRCVMFLGDTNTVLSSIVAAQLNIPIIHIEGCMRSYDWRMPEEKCRTVIDNLSDVIYTYFPEYKLQGVLEGLAPSRIVVVQNLIVDVLHQYYFPKIDEYKKIAMDYLNENKIEGEYFIATSHRRENVEFPETLQSIMMLFQEVKLPVIFPASYRTQKNISKFKIKMPSNVLMVDPIGYKLMLALMSRAKAVITDSGTVVEETAVIGVPSVQMRKATERPQTYDIGSSIKFEPGVDTPSSVLRKLQIILNSKWQHALGDGQASKRIVGDLEKRLYGDGAMTISTHAPSQYHLPIERSYRGDGIDS
jgi:UDP-N-acetylglucosamine 2-epimerase (non-hydrolysing)